MPTMHRISCFRDDIIFVVYLYQRWIYKVDKTRGLYATEEKKKAVKPEDEGDKPAIEESKNEKENEEKAAIEGEEKEKNDEKSKEPEEAATTESTTVNEKKTDEKNDQNTAEQVE